MLTTTRLAKGLVAVAWSAAEILVRRSGRQYYNQEKLLARLEANENDGPKLVIRADTMKAFNIQVVLDDGKGHRSTLIDGSQEQ